MATSSRCADCARTAGGLCAACRLTRLPALPAHVTREERAAHAASNLAATVYGVDSLQIEALRAAPAAAPDLGERSRAASGARRAKSGTSNDRARARRAEHERLRRASERGEVNPPKGFRIATFVRGADGSTREAQDGEAGEPYFVRDAAAWPDEWADWIDVAVYFLGWSVIARKQTLLRDRMKLMGQPFVEPQLHPHEVPQHMLDSESVRRIRARVGSPEDCHGMIRTVAWGQHVAWGLPAWVLPGWFTPALAAWLLDHYSGGEGGGGRASRFGTRTLRRLLADPRALADRIATSSPWTWRGALGDVLGERDVLAASLRSASAATP